MHKGLYLYSLSFIFEYCHLIVNNKRGKTKVSVILDLFD